MPTITYHPLSGDRLAKSLLAPVPVGGILYLIQADYPADLVLRVCVDSINGLENAYSGAGNPRPGDPRFHELMIALRESQADEDIGFRIKTTKDAETVVMFVRPSKNPEGAALGRKIRELLRLNATAREFSIVSGSFPESDTEIAILTRSITQVMVEFAANIDVPAADIAEERVYQPHRTAEQERMFPSLLAVRYGTSPPDDAYAAVRYRGQWFWIDDRDQQSKRAVTFLTMMFSLTQSAPAQAAPLVTIPAR